MNTPSQAPGTYLLSETEEILLTRMNHSAVTALAPIRSATHNETFMFQGQLPPALSHLFGWSWVRYSSFLVARIILRWTSRTDRGFDTSADATPLTTTRIVVIFQALILSVVTFADTYPTSKAAKSLAQATKLMERWTPSCCTPMVRRRVSDAWAVALVVACAYIGSGVYPPELRVVNTTHAALLGVVGRVIFLAMRNWILELDLWFKQQALMRGGSTA